MKAHYAAIQAKLAAIHTAYFVNVPSTPTLPYYLLWGSAGTLPAELKAAGQLGTDFDTTFNVTAVAGTGEGVLTMLAAARASLPATTVSGRLLAITLRAEQPTSLMVDRDVVLPDTDRHPVYGVDVYRLQSTPA